jgi:hypothetical protein
MMLYEIEAKRLWQTDSDPLVYLFPLGFEKEKADDNDYEASQLVLGVTKNSLGGSGLERNF